jgi:apolipoprotein N-acyltransferase
MVDSYNRRVRSALAGLLAAGLMVLAFPPYAVGWLAVVAVAVLLGELRRGRHPVVAGAVFGLGFYSGLVWWLSRLGIIALAPLVVVFAAYLALFGWLLGKSRTWPAPRWWLAATGGWALMEAGRLRFPLGGFEWGMAGYAMAPYAPARGAAQWIGTSGWMVVVVAVSAGIVVAVEARRFRPELVASGIAAAALLAGGAAFPTIPRGDPVRVAIVQGSTPCPGTHCPGERRGTYQQHLALTRTISAGAVDLVVWPESSTGSLDADPILNLDVREAMGAEARRLGAYLLAGGDRPISGTHWVNANVVFGPDGNIIGEYRKRHPVPFGEYIPARPLFEWIPALRQVPSDMVPGDGPVLFALGEIRLGSVISFEGAFARYGRQYARMGAGLLVLATNQDSYPFTPVSDQFIAMSQMRSAELGLEVVHSAVTGKSAFVHPSGIVEDEIGFHEEKVITATLTLREQSPTFYARVGDWIPALAVAGLGLATLRRWPNSPGSAPTSPTSRKS